MNGWHKEKTGVNETGGRFRLRIRAARVLQRGKTGTLCVMKSPAYGNEV